MTLNNILPLLIVLSAFVPGVLIFCTDENRFGLRRLFNIGGNILCIGLLLLLIQGVHSGEVYETRLPLLPGMDLVLHADALSLLFASLSGLLWFVTTLYAIGYLEGTKNRSRFFGFFSLCVAATLGIALAGNLITFVIFYELLTLTTYPLVVHKGNSASLRAGRIYLTYTMIGGALLLAGVVWLKALAGPLDFTATGILSALPDLDPDQLTIIFVLIIAGLGVKAALVPFHGWLPVAMAAPAPVSALLHAVAVVKAGAFGIIRVVYDVYGIEFARDLNLTNYLAAIAAITIIYGSVRALFQNDIKKRLAYSTVSQVSYIALGTAIAGPIATIGGMVHLVHQGLMKITLFFCAGNLAETLGIHKVSELNGVGRRMPLTMAAFTVAALGMIGLPPIAGFVSKWYLGTGAVEVEAYWILFVLAGSSLLNACYFLPLLHAAWFKQADKAWEPKSVGSEAPWLLLLPPLITASLAIAAGVFAGTTSSPLSWVELIAAREYGQELFRELQLTVAPLPQLVWVILIPVFFAIFKWVSGLKRWCLTLAPLAAVPAILVALFLSVGTNSFPGIFFGSVLSLDETSKLMLLLASLLWFIAGIYSWDYLSEDKNKLGFSFYFLLCMAGSFGLILSQDLFGFITFFTLMSFAAYGLIVHSGSDEAIKAGRSYIQWVVIGEVLLFAALVGLAISSNGRSLTEIDLTLQPEWVSWLLAIGFGIKAGLLGMHFWLPKAHPVAPVPASALLSGLMVKAGFLGWWRFLPLGEVALVDIGLTLIVLGLSGAFIAAMLGVIQRNPKALLAYSTVSQMGIISAGVGAGLFQPELWPVLSSALLLYVIHHGLAKAALFASVGFASPLSERSSYRWLWWGMMLMPAFAMIGLPFTSGALAKTSLKLALADIFWLKLLLPLTAIGTTLLMARFVSLLYAAESNSKARLSLDNTQSIAYALLLILVIAFVFTMQQANMFVGEIFSASAIWNAFWPALAGAVLYFLLRRIIGSSTAHFGERNINLLGLLSEVFNRLGNNLQFYLSNYVRSGDNFFMRVRTATHDLQLPAQVHPGVLFTSLLVCLIILLLVGGQSQLG